MNRQDIVSIISKKLPNLQKQEVKAVIDLLIVVIEEALKNEEKVVLTGLGTLSITNYRERYARNPTTGEKIFIPERKHIKWKAAPKLTEALN